MQMRLILPEGWTAGHYPRTLTAFFQQPAHGIFGDSSLEFDVTVGENVDAVNRAYMEIVSPNLCYTMMIPITFVG